MLEALIENLPWVVGLMGLFSFLAVASWSTERRKEREALYQSEAIKKIAEMQGNVPEPVMAVLREAVSAWKNTENNSNYSMWAAIHRHRNETLQKLAESPAEGANAVMEYLREEERGRVRRMREGLKVAGAICVAVGAALAIILRVMLPPDNPPVYVFGLIPVTVGVVLFGAARVVGPKAPA